MKSRPQNAPVQALNKVDGSGHKTWLVPDAVVYSARARTKQNKNPAAIARDLLRDPLLERDARLRFSACRGQATMRRYEGRSTEAVQKRKAAFDAPSDEDYDTRKAPSCS